MYLPLQICSASFLGTDGELGPISMACVEGDSSLERRVSTGSRGEGGFIGVIKHKILYSSYTS